MRDFRYLIKAYTQERPSYCHRNAPTPERRHYAGHILNRPFIDFRGLKKIKLILFLVYVVNVIWYSSIGYTFILYSMIHSVSEPLLRFKFGKQLSSQYVKPWTYILCNNSAQNCVEPQYVAFYNQMVYIYWYFHFSCCLLITKILNSWGIRIIIVFQVCRIYQSIFYIQWNLSITTT